MINSNFKTIDDYYERCFGNYDSKKDENKLLSNLGNITNQNKSQKLDFTIDRESADNGNTKTQDEWIKYFLEKNSVMKYLFQVQELFIIKII